MFRPFGAFAIWAFPVSLVLFSVISAQAPNTGDAGEVERHPPTLNLSVAGDFQQAVHFHYDQDRQALFRSPSLVAPLHALTVSAHDWVKIYTNSPLGLPRSARARIYMSARPEPCFGYVMIGCIVVDIESGGYPILLRPETAASFGFVAPSAPGSYWIALDADWGFGGRTQVFVIDVRA